VVDKDVRDTWEIEPARLSFTHPQWEAFIKNTVCTEVCKSLGVPMGKNPPKMELYKLLLYERGSQCVIGLPHLINEANSLNSSAFYHTKSTSSSVNFN